MTLNVPQTITARQDQQHPHRAHQVHSPSVPETPTLLTVTYAHQGIIALVQVLQEHVPLVSTARLVRVQPHLPTTHVQQATTALVEQEIQ